MSHALARSVTGFCGARFALGLGESGNYPTAIRVVTEWFPPKERSVANGIFNTGSNMGAIFAPVLVPFIVGVFGGWQAAFITLGLADFVWLAFWLNLYASPEKSKHVQAAELEHIRSGGTVASEQKIPWVKLLGYREAWAYYGTCVLVGPVWWFYGFWLPDFFNKQFHLDLKHFGPPLVVVYSQTALFPTRLGMSRGASSIKRPPRVAWPAASVLTPPFSPPWAGPAPTTTICRM